MKRNDDEKVSINSIFRWGTNTHKHKAIQSKACAIKLRASRHSYTSKADVTLTA